MPLEWKDSPDAVDWEELSALYRAAPLGNKTAASLKTSFSNSMYRCFVRDRLGKQIVGHLVELSRGHRQIILYAVPGKEPFYRKFGFSDT